MMTFEEWCEKNIISIPPHVRSEIEKYHNVNVDSEIMEIKKHEYACYVQQNTKEVK